MQNHRATKRHAGLWFVFGLAMIAVFGACPNTTPTAMELTRVEPVTRAVPPVFRLKIFGHGFGLSSLDINVARGSARPSADGIDVVLKTRAGQAVPEVSGTQARVVSPSELDVEIFLRAALPAGIYGISALAGDTEVTLDAAFVVGASHEPMDAAAPADRAENLDGGDDATVAGDRESSDR